MIIPKGLLIRTPGQIFRILLSFVAVILLATSCEEPDDLGQQIITRPGEKFSVQLSDTSSVIGHSALEDSIRTDETTRNMLGSMVDPVFGKTEASIFTQLRLSTNNLSFGTNPKLDSVVLILQYQGEYALNPISKWDKLVRVSVYELTEKMERDSIYYSNQSIAFDPNAIGDITMLPRPLDSVMVDSQMLPPMFRIPLSAAFGQKILNGSGTIYLSDNDNFIDYVKGLYIRAYNMNNRGSINYISLLSSYSRVALYYHNDEDTLVQDFVINDNCARFNRFDHFGYSDARSDLQNQILNGGDTLLGASKLFIQPTGGIRTKIYFPFLQNWVDGREIAISRAELIIKGDSREKTLNTLAPPSYLALVKIREDGSNAFITDQVTEGSDVFGGTYDADKNEYHFSITWHIQELLDGRSVDRGLYLAVSGNAVNANRVVLGGSDSDDRIRLVLTYIEL